MKKLWFKRKTYGYGWMPVSLEGWLTTLIAVAIVIFVAVKFETNVLYTSLTIILTIIVLLAICIKTGEKPRWQWGNKNNEKIKKTKL